MGKLDEKWTPGNCARSNVEACEDLDRHVRAIDWDERAVEFGSRERQLVGSWMQASGIVADAMRRLYPDPSQRETMVRWVSVRLWEKITGTALESNPNAWNWAGLWNPLEPTSFAGWARELSLSLAKWNGRRVLKSRTLLESDLRNEEDDYDPMVDRADSKPVGMAQSDDIFRDHPGLMVFRPVGRVRDELMKAFTDERAAGVVRFARENGMWHHSLDTLPDEVVGALMLMPLKREVGRLVELADDPLHLPRELKAAYWPTQLSAKRMRDRDYADLRRLVLEAARERGVNDYDVWLSLGTAAARLATV